SLISDVSRRSIASSGNVCNEANCSATLKSCVASEDTLMLLKHFERYNGLPESASIPSDKTKRNVQANRFCTAILFHPLSHLQSFLDYKKGQKIQIYLQYN